MLPRQACNQEDSHTDRNRCHDNLDSLAIRYIPQKDLIAQETVALATRGLLLTGAWQAVFSLGALIFLAFTVYQTGRMVRHS